MAHCLKGLLGGDKVRFRDYPVLASYFNLKTEAEMKLAFTPRSPVLLYCGGNGPKSLAVAGRLMDGLIYGPSFVPAVRVGKLEDVLTIADNAATEASTQKRLRKVAEINVSLSSNARSARDFPRPFVASMVVSLRESGYTAEDFLRLGVKPTGVDRLEQAYRHGATYEEAAALVTEDMIDATIIAGNMDSCKERITEVCQAAREHGFHQVMFSKLGPDYREAMRLLADVVSR
jgi:alkanesulfonate monooxygenase SsuD/methylene tetrahydromethanopterin reductase-like flavin-dependent oxidoreductase (luciferase family)